MVLQAYQSLRETLSSLREARLAARILRSCHLQQSPRTIQVNIVEVWSYQAPLIHVESKVTA